MTKRLFASSLAAAFSFGTAFGITLSDLIGQGGFSTAQESASNKSLPDPPSSQPDTPKPGPEDKGRFVCKDVDGATLCWPRESAPDDDDQTYCHQNEGSSNCLVRPVIPKPKSIFRVFHEERTTL